MIVCRKRKLLFAHVPKTGGLSIESALGFKNHNLGKRHAPWSEVGRLAIPYIEAGFRYFAVHRDPWDRVISGYFYHKRKLKVDIQFDTFVKLAVEDGSFLKPAVVIAGPMVTDWLDFSRLEIDFRNLLTIAGEESPPALPHKNSNPTVFNKTKYLTRKFIDTVSKYHAEDIEKFGYKPPEIP